MVVVVVSHFVHMAKSEKIHMLEQMVWLIDLKGWTAASIFVKVRHETTKVLQNHYPERLGVAILYNPPKIFESFWTVLNPFLEPKTYRKVKFVYSKDSRSMKIMEQRMRLGRDVENNNGIEILMFSLPIVAWCVGFSSGGPNSHSPLALHSSSLAWRAALETIKQVHCVVITLFEEAKADVHKRRHGPGPGSLGSPVKFLANQAGCLLQMPLKEPLGGAHADPKETYKRIKYAILRHLTALKLVSPEKIKEDCKAKFIGTSHYEDIELDAASTRNMKADAASISESTNNANPSQLKLGLSDNGAIDSSNLEEIESQRQQNMNQKRLGL
ncbi:hypothetical protein SUGI_0511100 [Cryptomeria japonica]|nr:hypothetical protein SUGI_0511100 [Cryptomeria japonica]